MSQLTLWLAGAAAFVFCILGANAFFYRRRFGTFLRSAARSQIKSGHLSWRELFVLVLLVGTLLVGFGTPYVAPSSSFSLWLFAPYSRVVYFAWCILGAVTLNTVLAVPAVFKRHRSVEIQVNSENGKHGAPGA